MASGYTEPQLLTNRAPVLLHGSTEGERRAWADESARSFDLPAATVVDSPDRLREALLRGQGVIYVPDIAAMGPELQGLVVRCLREREERPKLIIGVTGSVSASRADGRIREDLHFALHRGEVNLASPELRALIAERRARAPKIEPEKKPPAKRR